MSVRQADAVIQRGHCGVFFFALKDQQFPNIFVLWVYINHYIKFLIYIYFTIKFVNCKILCLYKYVYTQRLFCMSKSNVIFHMNKNFVNKYGTSNWDCQVLGHNEIRP
jgi:hypothetical protein